MAFKDIEITREDLYLNIFLSATGTGHLGFFSPYGYILGGTQYIHIYHPLVVEERTAGVYLKHPTPTPTRLGSGKAISKDRTSKPAGMLAQRLEQVLGDW